jgi:hypothetical protein
MRAEIQRRELVAQARQAYVEQLESFRAGDSNVSLSLDKIGIKKAPKISGCVCIAGWRTNEKITPFMKEIGNITSAYHGTHEYNIYSITRNSLSVSKSHEMCLYGKGIYTAPNVNKARNYGRFAGVHQFILVVKVALGNPLKNPTSGQYSWDKLSKDGFHSVFAGAGVILGGVWGGYLNNSECVVYRDDQAIISEIYEYAAEPQKPVYAHIKPVIEKPKEVVKIHACRRHNKLCRHARNDDCANGLGKGYYRKNPGNCPFYSVDKGER